jgi:hypothetical protein
LIDYLSKAIPTAFWRIHQICIAHIAEELVYELNMISSYHAHLAAEMDALFRARVGEMRGKRCAEHHLLKVVEVS